MRDDLARAIVTEATKFTALKKVPAQIVYEAAKKSRTDTAAAESAIKGELAAAMLKKHKDVGTDKWPFGMITSSKKVVIENKQKAYDWGVEHKACLMLDEKAIKKIAEHMKPDGVKS